MTTATPQVLKPRARLVGLDGLRGILAFCVVLVHVTAHFSPTILNITHAEVFGQAIVIFFVLSGFLIYLPFLRSLVSGRDPLGTIGRYAKGRVLRVFPAYIVIFLVSNFVLGAVFIDNAMMVQESGSEGGTGIITDPLRLLAHLTLVQNYLPGELQTGINSSWTLTTELAYYVVLPIVAWATYRIARAAKLKPLTAAVIPGVFFVVVGLVSRVIAFIWSANGPYDPVSAEWGPNMLAVFSRSLPVWADNFGWGMLAAVVFLVVSGRVTGADPATGGADAIRSDRAFDGSLRRLLWVVAIVGLVVSAASFFLLPRFIGAAFAVFAAALVLLLALPLDAKGRTWRVSTWIDNPVLYWLGTISLSLYLWHFPVILVLQRLGWTGGDTWGGWAWNLLLVFAVSSAIATLSYRLIELPSIKLAARRRPDPRPAADGVRAPS